MKQSSYGFRPDFKKTGVKHGDPGIDYAGPKGTSIPNTKSLSEALREATEMNNPIRIGVEKGSMKEALNNIEKAFQNGS